MKGWLFRPISDRLYYKAGVNSHKTWTNKVPLTQPFHFFTYFFLTLLSIFNKNPYLSTNRCLRAWGGAGRGGGTFLGLPTQKTVVPTRGKSEVWVEHGPEQKQNRRRTEAEQKQKQTQTLALSSLHQLRGFWRAACRSRPACHHPPLWGQIQLRLWSPNWSSTGLSSETFWPSLTDKKNTINMDYISLYLNCYSSHTLDSCISNCYLSINHVNMKFLWSFNK